MLSMFGPQEVETGAGLGRGGIHELGGVGGGEVGDEQQGAGPHQGADGSGDKDRREWDSLASLPSSFPRSSCMCTQRSR